MFLVKSSFFEPNNLRNVLDEMLSVVGIRSKIKVLATYDAIYINYVDQNKIGNKIESLKAVTRTMSQNIEYMAGNIETYVNNSLARVPIMHPSPNGWDSFRTTEAVLDTNNCQMMFKFNIEDIIQTYVKCEVDYRATYYKK